MSDLPTIEQAICSRTNAHCATCRDREGGRPWRAELAAVVIVPAGALDFACPLGHPWGYAPLIVIAATPDLISQRLAICQQCDEWNGNLCERQFPCGKCLGGWINWLGDSGGNCPKKQW